MSYAKNPEKTEKGELVTSYCCDPMTVDEELMLQKGNKFEVVDGQQRLTSLYLLLNCLGLDVKNSLTFACRDKSNYTHKNIKELLLENRSKLDMERMKRQ